MYGTVAHIRAKPGTEQQFTEIMKEYESVRIPGAVASYVYRTDADPNEYILVAVFESRDSYFANAESPEQDARYQKMRGMLVSDPEWHDGEIVHSETFSSTPTR